MGLFELFILAVGLSMDAFAVSTSNGIVSRPDAKKTLLIAFTFGLFQAVMPLIGYFAGSLFADAIQAYDHWIALLLLAFIGGKMVADFFCKKDEKAERKPLTAKTLLVQAVATSIDALAVGVSFVGITFNIFLAVAVIGLITFVLCVVAVIIGKKCGDILSDKATLVGGLILIAIGLKIFIEHITM